MSDQMELDFTKGYNAGYLLAKFKPELAKLVIKDLQAANEYNAGMLQGHKEFIKEKDKSIPNLGKENIKDLGKGKDR